MSAVRTARRPRRKKSAQIVTLSRAIIPSPREPDEDIIRHLEWVLERARAGEITSALTVYAYADGAVGHCQKGPAHFQRGLAMLGALELAKNELVEMLK